jgi:hypothetical protein
MQLSAYSFSGHEKFACRHFWLKKGFEYFSNTTQQNETEDVVALGVGKNMVSAIRHWIKAFGLMDEKMQPSEVGKYLFGNKGKDHYLEDYGSLWLLHYQLLRTGKASLYHLVFNELRRERSDFTKEQLQKYIERRCREFGFSGYNANTVNSDIDVLFRNYVKPRHYNKQEAEDDFSSLLIDLDLIKEYDQLLDNKKITWYSIASDERDDLPWQVVLFVILDYLNGQSSISFTDLQTVYDLPGSVFAINSEGLYNKIKLMTANFPRQIVFDETAGNRVLQFKNALDKWTVLDGYYN